MALSADRDTPKKDGEFRVFPVKGSTTIYAGALVAINSSGFAVPGAVAATLKAVGRAEERVVNAGADGAVSVTVRRGVFQFKNSADADLIALDDVNANCYIVDDETVALTSDSSARSIAGVIHDVDANGVWVRF